MTLNARSGLPDTEAPKNLREGEPYNDPKFEELARTYGVWGTAHAALCAEFWQAARRAQAVLDGWLPISENINALPEPLRQYICDLETNADPSGMVRHNTILRDQVAGLQVMYRKAVDALAAAPQPPEAAPVQLPEPAVIATTTVKTPASRDVEFNWPIDSLVEEGEHKLYTEQQVCQLLAAHGIT